MKKPERPRLVTTFWIGLGIVCLLRMDRMAEGFWITSPDSLTSLRIIGSGPHIAIAVLSAAL
jgi:hypothetical protein